LYSGVVVFLKEVEFPEGGGVGVGVKGFSF
jgi:hypothetical protein